MKKILIANVGSTSYKYTVFEIFSKDGCKELVRGGVERVVDYEQAIAGSLSDLEAKGFAKTSIDAVAFKTVLGKNLSGLRDADDAVLKALEDMSYVAPAHNPPYAAAIRAFGKVLPSARKIVLFETSFYQWADKAWKRYAVPQSWDSIGVRRNGFHGASHKFAAERVAELCGETKAAESARLLYVNNGRMKLEKPFRMVNCHLGGSSSVCGILDGAAIGSSMGFSPQSGLPQNNRVGDLDSMAIPFAMATLGIGVDEALKELSKDGGLLGISGVSNDMPRNPCGRRRRRRKGATGNRRSCVFDALLHRQFMAQMGGLDAIGFSGAIAENNPCCGQKSSVRFEGSGFKIDEEINSNLKKSEGVFSTPDSKIKAVAVVATKKSS